MPVDAESASPRSACTAALLDRAAALCAGRGARLTSLRREVLGLILESDGPVGAYDLLDRLKARRGLGAPPTVYRALEFLQEQGLVHRLQRLSAYVGCTETFGTASPCPPASPRGGQEALPRHAPAQFLICRRCGRVIELEDRGLAEALAAAAARVGFALSAATVEAEGECADCRARTEAPPSSAGK